MIYTRMGTKVTIVARESDYRSVADVNFGAWVLARYENTWNERTFRICDLKADNGATEIAEAVFAAPIQRFLQQGQPA